MSIPNVGISGVIQDQGIGGAVGSSFGNLSSFLMNLEKIRQDDANEKARIALAQQELAQQQAAAQAKAQQERVALEEAQRLRQSLGRGFNALSQGDRPGGNLDLTSIGQATGTPMAGNIHINPVDAIQQAFKNVAPGDQAAFQAAAKDLISGIMTGREKAADRAGNTAVVGNNLVRTQTGARVFEAPAKPSAELTDAGILTGVDLSNPKALSPEQRGALKDYIFSKMRAGSTKISTTLNLGEEAFKKKLGELNAGLVETSYNEANGAHADLDAIAEGKAQVRNGIYTGSLADLQLTAAKGLEALGIARDPRIPATEQFGIAMGKRAAALLKSRAFGSGTGISDNDLKAVNKLTLNDKKLDPRTIAEGLDAAERIDRAIIKGHNRRINGIKDLPKDQRSILTVPEDATGFGQAQSQGQQATQQSNGKINYNGKLYTPKIRAADGKRYISTPDGDFEVN